MASSNEGVIYAESANMLMAEVWKPDSERGQIDEFAPFVGARYRKFRWSKIGERKSFGKTCHMVRKNRDLDQRLQ